MNNTVHQTKHTQGPWHRNIRANGKYPTIFAGRNTHIAVAQQRPDADETEANIDLISAAPELLSAVKGCASLLDSLLNGSGQFDQDELDRALTAAQNAIWKSEGSTNRI